MLRRRHRERAGEIDEEVQRDEYGNRAVFVLDRVRLHLRRDVRDGESFRRNGVLREGSELRVAAGGFFQFVLF